MDIFSEISPYIFSILGLVFGSLITVAVKFDLNKWLEARSKRKKEYYKLKMIENCLHLDFNFLPTTEGRTIPKAKPLFYTTYGSVNLFCIKCGCETFWDEQAVKIYINNTEQELIKNPKRIEKKIDSFNKYKNKYQKI